MVTLRSGAPLWLRQRPNRICRYPTLTRDLTADVVVVGGGMTGSLVAWMFASRDARVAVLEGQRVRDTVYYARRPPGHAHSGRSFDVVSLRDLPVSGSTHRHYLTRQASWANLRFVRPETSSAIRIARASV
jgi:glycine/D-amino acid oxidase-like deaminating enzyme